MSRYGALAPSSVTFGTAPTDDIRLVPDPAGSGSVVALFDSHNLRDTGNGYPRADASTPHILDIGGKFWTAHRIYIGPEQEMRDDWLQWISLVTPAFGPPYTGSSPLGMAIAPAFLGDTYRGYNRLQVAGDPSLIGQWQWTFGTWVQIAYHYFLSPDGWVEMWWRTDTEGAWRRIPFQGNASGPQPYATVGPQNSGGPNFSQVGVYGTQAAQVHHAVHRIGTSLDSINAPADGWVPLDLP